MITPALSKSETKKPLLAEGSNVNVENFKELQVPDFLNITVGNDYSKRFFTERRSEIQRTLNPAKNPRALVEIGDIHVANGNLNAAIKAYRDAIRKDSTLVEAYMKLIPLLIKKKGRVEGYFDKVLEATNHHPDFTHQYLLYKLSTARSTVELDVVKAGLQAIIASNGSLDFKNSLGVLYFKYSTDASLILAEKIFKDILRANPVHVDALNNYGICLQSKSQFEEAARHYDAALNVDPRYSAAYENRASNNLAQGNIQDALKILKKGKAIGLDFTDLWEHNIGWLMLLSGDLKEARAWYVTKIQEEKDNNLLYNNLGVCYEGLGNLEKALENYKKSAEIAISKRKYSSHYDDPRAVNGVGNFCRLLFRNRDHAMLEVAARELLHFDQSNALAHFYSGTAKLHLRKYDSARMYLEEAIRLDPDLQISYIDLSFLLTSILLKYSEAITVLESAIDRGFKKEILLNNLAYAYIKDGALDKANDILKTIDSHPNTYATKGLYQYHTNNFKKGNSLYEKALSSIEKEYRKEVEQTWYFEQANYWLNKGNSDNARDFVKKAKDVSKDTFVYPQVLSLEKILKI
jgi:tetratricopeptide (TPR) repeat protein